MGSCWNCETELSLQEGQTRCDKCGNIVWYRCNSCKEGFETADEKGKKIKECPLCGYFYCSHCGICSWSCPKYKWEADILKILSPEVTQGKIPSTLVKVREIVNYFEKVKTSNERKECINHIPITYAKGRIKSLLARIDGYKVKNNADIEAFNKRINEIKNLPLQSKITVSKIRENGSYGQEYRDAFNLLVCLGKLKITWQKKKDSEEEYALYERIEESACKSLDIKDLVINECPKCKTNYNLNTKYCQKCIIKKGKKKGLYFENKKRLNNKDTCQVYRGDFNGKLA